MSELDFDRSLPPIMPGHGQWFNDRVSKLVEQACGDEDALREVVIKIPRQRNVISMFEYPTTESVQHGL